MCSNKTTSVIHPYLLGAAFVVASFSFAESAEPLDAGVSLFGVELGKPVTLPLCPIDAIAGIVSINRNAVSNVCQYAPLKGDDQYLEIDFPDNARPTYLYVGWVTVDVRDGVAQHINVSTRGTSVQDDVLQRLSQKFGAPTKIDRPMESNAFGASWAAIDAQWIGRQQDHLVTFHSATSSIDFGEIDASTAKWRAEEAAKRLAHEKQMPQL
jgi:hypothetical protein